MSQTPRSWDDCYVYPEDIRAGADEHSAAHDRLFELVTKLPSDFEPYGQRVRGGWNSSDCSCGCRHYAELSGPLGHDRGVCMNRRSPRAGLLTFEHQGCPEFETGPQREFPGRTVIDEGPASV